MPLICDVTALHRMLGMNYLDINDEEHHGRTLKTSFISCDVDCEMEWHLIPRVSPKSLALTTSEIREAHITEEIRLPS